MGRTCIVPGCTKRSNQGDNISFHRFPLRQPEKLKLWLDAIGLHTNCNVASHHRICSNHFCPSDFYLIHPSNKKVMKDRAVPSRNLKPSSCPKLINLEQQQVSDMDFIPTTSAFTLKNGHYSRVNGDILGSPDESADMSQDSENFDNYYGGVAEELMQQVHHDESSTSDQFSNGGNANLEEMQKERLRRQMQHDLLLFEQRMLILKEEMEEARKERQIKSEHRQLATKLVQVQLEKAQLELEEVRAKNQLRKCLQTVSGSSTPDLKIDDDDDAQQP